MQETTELSQQFIENIYLLQRLLNKTLERLLEPDVINIIHRLKNEALRFKEDPEKAIIEISNIIQKLKPIEILTITRVLSMSLNLTNIAEQYHRIRRRRFHQSLGKKAQAGSLEAMFIKFQELGIDINETKSKIKQLHIDLVLTAHPTEVIRRTLMHKYNEIAKGLEILDREDLTPIERERIIETLHEEIIAAWQTKETRHEKPTAMDEARFGFAVIEESIWQAYPEYMRELDRCLEKFGTTGLDLDIVPIRFSSWMGGDRDGNPNVTSEVTREVALLARWKAADLYWHDINQLRDSLSMNECSQELRRKVGSADEPYRTLLRSVKERLFRTKQWANFHIERREVCPTKDLVYLEVDDLLEPLMICYRSLKSTGADIIAEGRMLDIIRKVKCFGLTLLPLDIRQHAEKHQDLMNALTSEWGMGSYLEWSEQDRINFLIEQLENGPTIIGATSHFTSELQEMINTFRVISSLPYDSFGAYIISMASNPSDILLVLVLQKICGVTKPLRVVPLFETLDDLNTADACMDQLFSIPQYRNLCKGVQEVMIGYSDSAKDAGFFAASFAQYQAQSAIYRVAKKHNIKIVFFHGRGGSIGRGGGPSHLILRTKPKETLDGHYRITQQGEVIRYRFGLQKIAERTLDIFTTSTLEAMLNPGKAIKPKWLEKMNMLSKKSLSCYRTLIENPDFIRYFRQVTPVNEFDKITIASRPTRRRQSGGIENLRAIPWVFAWTQNRLILPAWYGVGEALESFNTEKDRLEIKEIVQEWFYLSALIAVIDMELAKVSPLISKQYEKILADTDLWPLGASLRDSFEQTKAQILDVLNHHELLEDQAALKDSIELRAPELLILHLLQIYCLKKTRDEENSVDEHIMRALLVSIAGIATGMQNTG